MRTIRTASVGRILIYPIKSLDSVAVSAATVLSTGALTGDREFALVDESGRWINAKREPGIHRIRAEYDASEKRVTLRGTPELQPETETFHLIDDRQKLEDWFSGFFGYRTRLERNTLMGFPDDTESPGPTIISVASLLAVGGWFSLTPEETRRRFRANIELETDEPFWEDRLYTGSGDPRTFRIGTVTLEGINPCQRCAVPSRNPDTGVVLENFQRAFADRRAAALPSWAPAPRFDHYYRLSVNTRIPASEAGKTIHAGDIVELAQSYQVF